MVISGTNDNRSLGYLSVEPRRQEDSFRRQCVIEALTAHPLGIGIRSGPGTHGSRDLLRGRMAAHWGDRAFEPARNRMYVAVTERRADEAA